MVYKNIVFGLHPLSQVDIDLAPRHFTYTVATYIWTVISQDISLKNTPTSHAVNLALFMHACSDSAMLFCRALAYANGFYLHLLVLPLAQCCVFGASLA